MLVNKSYLLYQPIVVVLNVKAHNKFPCFTNIKEERITVHYLNTRAWTALAFYWNPSDVYWENTIIFKKKISFKNLVLYKIMRLLGLPHEYQLFLVEIKFHYILLNSPLLLCFLITIRFIWNRLYIQFPYIRIYP